MPLFVIPLGDDALRQTGLVNSWTQDISVPHMGMDHAVSTAVVAACSVDDSESVTSGMGLPSPFISSAPEYSNGAAECQKSQRITKTFFRRLLTTGD